MNRIVLLVVCLSSLFSASCGEAAPPTPEEMEKAANAVTATYRDRIVAQHALYLEIARAAAAVPAGAVPPIDLGEGATLPRSRTHDDRQDIDLKFLLDPAIDPFRAPDFLSMGGTGWYASPLGWLKGEWGEIFRDRTPETVTAFMTEWFEDFLAPKYLLVFRAHEFKVPKRLEDYDEPKDGTFGQKFVGAFEPGTIEGDVLVFDVATKTCLGGVSFTGKNSGEVTAERFKTDPEFLRTDLSRSAWYSVDQALKPFLSPR